MSSRHRRRPSEGCSTGGLDSLLWVVPGGFSRVGVRVCWLKHTSTGFLFRWYPPPPSGQVRTPAVQSAWARTRLPGPPDDPPTWGLCSPICSDCRISEHRERRQDFDCDVPRRFLRQRRQFLLLRQRQPCAVRNAHPHRPLPRLLDPRGAAGRLLHRPRHKLRDECVVERRRQ